MQCLKIGTLKDSNKYLLLGAMAYRENAVNGLFDFDKAQKYMNNLLSKPLDQVCPLLLEEDDLPVGLLIGSIVEDNFSSNRYAVEHHWYVVPHNRKGGGGLKLLDAFEYWAKQNKVDAVWLSSGSNPTVSKLLERKYKYKLSSNIMIKEI